MKKKILIVCPFAQPNIGGVESHLAKLINVCISKSYYPVLITYQPLTVKVRGMTHEITDTYEIHRTNWFGIGWFPKLEKYFPLVFLYLFPGLFVSTAKYYIKNHSDIHAIHAHGFAAAAIVRILTFIYPKNSVVSTHAVYNFEKRKFLGAIIRVVLSGFNTILAVSEVSRKEIIKMGFAPERVKVHPNWIDTNVFKILSEDKRLISIPKGFNILFLARLIELKGTRLLLQAAKALPEINFHILGNGPMEEEVKEYSLTNNNIIYHGVFSQFKPDELEKLIYLYNRCDFLISPYIYDEGFSTTLIESLACGTPLIITDRGSPPTFISKDVAYFLSKEPTVMEIVEVLNKLKNSHEYEASKCRKFAESNFGISNAEVVLNSYEML